MIHLHVLVQVLILVTDGKQTTSMPYTELTVASQGIKDKGVSVYAVGVGRGPAQSELQQIASTRENVFLSESFKGVISLAPLIRGKLCDCKSFFLGSNSAFSNQSSLL